MQNLLFDPFYTIVSAPFTWIFLGLCGAFFFIQTLVSRADLASKPPKTLWDVFGLAQMHPFLRSFLGLLWSVLFAVFLAAVLWTLFAIAKAGLGDLEKDYRLFLLTLAAMTAGLSALIALPFTLIRTKNLTAQTRATEQGLVTDRLNKAVEGLGAQKEVNRLGRNVFYKQDGKEFSGFQWQGDPIETPKGAIGSKAEAWSNIAITEPNLEVRIGSIYALERIAQDNLDYHLQIMDILCAYVRQNAPAKDTVPTEDLKDRAVPRDDIQAVIRVIGRRANRCVQLEWSKRYRLDLRRCDLSGVDFTKSDFSGAMFHYSRLEAAEFSNAKLWGAEFYRALLNYADWHQSDLRGARLDHSILNRPLLDQYKSQRTLKLAKVTTGLVLIGADLTAAGYLGKAKQVNAMFGSVDTKLSEKLMHKQRDWPDTAEALQDQLLDARALGDVVAEQEATKLIAQTSFATWSPYTYNDGATVGLLRAFWQEHDLTSFPFHGTPKSE